MRIRCRLLINCCRQILDSFSEESTSVDSHVEWYFCAAETPRDLDEVEKVFVTEVFSGCVCFKAVLNVIVSSFYNTDGATVLTAERNLYNVLTYLTVIRLSELGMEKFMQFVRSQSAIKMMKFFEFVLVEDRIRTWMRDEWNTLFDSRFVDANLIEPLLRHLPQLWSMLSDIRNQIECEKSLKKCNVKSPTVPQPFSMSIREKPCSISVPPQSAEGKDEVKEQSRKQRPSKNWRKTLYEESQISQQLESVKLNNKVKSLMLLQQSNENPMSVWKTEKSERTKQRMREIINEQEIHQRGLEPTRTSANWTTAITQNVSIKTNAATILREARLYEKREQEELSRLERLVAGEFDGSEFNAWQTRMRQMDELEEAELAEMRRIDGQLSKEEAVLARHAHHNHNKQRAALVKAEAERLMQRYMRMRIEEQERMRKLAENVINSQQNVKQIKAELIQYKASIVQNMNCELKAMMQQALEEAEAEMRQKMEVIEGIREMEARISAASAAGLHHKMIDPTETAGYGFLCEMSLAELRERLRIQEAAEQARLDTLRENIQAEKEIKEEVLTEALQRISKHREEISYAAAKRSAEKKRAAETKYQTTRYRSEAVEERERRLEERKAERRAEDERSRIHPQPSVNCRKKTMLEKQGRTHLEESLRRVQENSRSFTPGLATATQSDTSLREIENKNKSRVALLAL